jgi:hypothetical protein
MKGSEVYQQFNESTSSDLVKKIKWLFYSLQLFFITSTLSYYSLIIFFPNALNGIEFSNSIKFFNPKLFFG